MKKIIFITILVCSVGFSQSNNVSTLLGTAGYVSQTMTASVDTMDVAVGGYNSKPYSFISIVATSTGTDTVEVYSLARDGSTWSQKTVKNMATDTSATSAYVSTTAKEFIVNDPQPMKIRLISTSNDGSTTTVLVQGKYGIR